MQNSSNIITTKISKHPPPKSTTKSVIDKLLYYDRRHYSYLLSFGGTNDSANANIYHQKMPFRQYIYNYLNKSMAQMYSVGCK